MTAALAASTVVAAGIALPHLLRLERVPPVTAAVLWLSSLALRALAGVLAVVYLLFFLPRTELFEVLTHWCLHTVLPVSGELGLEGHGVGDLTLYVPGAVLAISLVVVCMRTARSARRARRLLAYSALGHGPLDSLIVSGGEVAFAVAGIARPRIVVSAGALAQLDDAELAAALAHEQAHIARGHRYVMLLALGLQALGRLVPGGARAVRELAFQLERDADRCALRRTDALALASVICKAAGGDEQPAIARLDGSGVRERLGQLLEEPSPPRTGAALNALAATMVACTLLLAALVPAAAVAGAGDDAHRTHHELHCAH